MSEPILTTTFLFTDIAGSTRRWEQWPAAMAAALTRHDLLLAEAIAAHGGQVFKTVGDAFCAVFASTGPAVAAALGAQRALAAEDWAAFAPDLPALSVRMAIHAGPVEARSGDYFGPTVNRVARLLATGHGGQVLLSDVAAELAAEALPAGASLRSLGRHRLKDLGSPVEVFQLLAAGLAADCPLLSSLDRLRHMDARFRLLTGGDRTALPRHQTLRACLDWSYELLAADERRVLERLGVFAGELPRLHQAVEFDAGDIAARLLVESSLAIKRTAAPAWDVATCLNILGEICRQQGDITGAIRRFEEALDLNPGEPWGLANLAARQARMDLPRAARHGQGRATGPRGRRPGGMVGCLGRGRVGVEPPAPRGPPMPCSWRPPSLAGAPWRPGSQWLGIAARLACPPRSLCGL